MPADADDAAMEAARLKVEEGLDAVHARAYALVGGEDPGARPEGRMSMPLSLMRLSARDSAATPMRGGAALAVGLSRGKEDADGSASGAACRAASARGGR